MELFDKEVYFPDTNVGDTVSKQAAIDAMCDACSDWCDEGVCKKVSAIQKLPSAERRGRWIDKKYRWIKSISMWWSSAYKCSICGEAGIKDWNFCPNCGADMRGEKDEHND